MSSTPITTRINIVVADDHPVYRDGFRFMVSKQKEKNIRIAGEAANGEELLQLVEKTKPDIVVTDILMPVMNGIEATQKIREYFPGTRVLAISMSAEDSLVMDMFEAGAKGYLIKNASREEIIQSIEVVNQNGIYYSNATSKSLIARIINSDHNPYKKPKNISFSDREINIMRLMCRQMTTKEIASILQLSTRTVEDYRYKIQDKTGARCAIGIVLYAVRHGYVKWQEL
jgi:DNA-binding NarL/FixJ family response regulator